MSSVDDPKCCSTEGKTMLKVRKYNTSFHNDTFYDHQIKRLCSIIQDKTVKSQSERDRDVVGARERAQKIHFRGCRGGGGGVEVHEEKKNTTNVYLKLLKTK